MRMCGKAARRGFSLIELVIVVVIIGIIAAIAIPRMSRGAEGASEAAVEGNLSVLRSAIDLYATEHEGTFPGLGPGGSTFIAQMTQYTDNVGGVSATKTATHIYGPYLRKMPICPTGSHKGQTGVAAPATLPPSAEVSGANVGWLYDAATGQIWVNDVDHISR
jgi:prepilin-type N-terminal cleavage/methylation domain-containing protein